MKYDVKWTTKWIRAAQPDFILGRSIYRRPERLTLIQEQMDNE